MRLLAEDHVDAVNLVFLEPFMRPLGPIRFIFGAFRDRFDEQIFLVPIVYLGDYRVGLADRLLAEQVRVVLDVAHAPVLRHAVPGTSKSPKRPIAKPARKVNATSWFLPA